MNFPTGPDLMTTQTYVAPLTVARPAQNDLNKSTICAVTALNSSRHITPRLGSYRGLISQTGYRRGRSHHGSICVNRGWAAAVRVPRRFQQRQQRRDRSTPRLAYGGHGKSLRRQWWRVKTKRCTADSRAVLHSADVVMCHIGARS